MHWIRLTSTGWPMGVAAAVLVAAATAVPSAQQAPDAHQVLQAAGDYVRAAFPLLATVVATEEYVQERRVGPKAKGRLRSEVLLVRHPTQARDWLFFRDVLDVDGVPLQDHQTRLQDLFLNPTVENWLLVGDIANASQRYHVDGVNAGVTNPFVVVALLDRSYGARIQSKLGKEDRDVLAKIPRETTKTKDITGGLPRVVELFEARKPKDPAVISEIDGIVKDGGVVKGQRKLIIVPDDGSDQREYSMPRVVHINVHEGERVRAAASRLRRGRHRRSGVKAVGGVKARTRPRFSALHER